MKKYTVVIPVYNESRNIKKCLNQVLAYHKHILVVNDGSTDTTAEVLNSIKGISTIHLKQNSGKGYAMRVGAKKAFQTGSDGVIFMDGDNQHHPRHIAEFIAFLKKGHEIVIGVRLLKTDIPLYRKIGNLMMIGLMRHLFSVSISDMLCGYRAFSKSGYAKIKWQSDDYGVEAEVLTKIGSQKISYSTIVVDTIYHDKYKGFSILDGLKIVTKIPGWKLKEQ